MDIEQDTFSSQATTESSASTNELGEGVPEALGLGLFVGGAVCASMFKLTELPPEAIAGISALASALVAALGIRALRQ